MTRDNEEGLQDLLKEAEESGGFGIEIKSNLRGIYIRCQKYEFEAVLEPSQIRDIIAQLEEAAVQVDKRREAYLKEKAIEVSQTKDAFEILMAAIDVLLTVDRKDSEHSLNTLFSAFATVASKIPDIRNKIGHLLVPQLIQSDIPKGEVTELIAMLMEATQEVAPPVNQTTH